MITGLIPFLGLVLVLVLVYWVVSLFVQGTPLKIVGAILGLVALVKGLALVGINLL